MTSKYAFLVLTAAILAGCESPKPAPSRPPDVSSAGSVDYQQRDIEGRIEQYFRAGRLSRADYDALKNQVDDIRRDERRYVKDSDLSGAEKRALNARLESLSREVDRRADRR